MCHAEQLHFSSRVVPLSCLIYSTTTGCYSFSFVVVSQVNHFTTIPTKAFAKKAACFPEAVTAGDFNSFTTTFTADEKVRGCGFFLDCCTFGPRIAVCSVSSYHCCTLLYTGYGVQVHIVMLVAEARRQATLLYGLNAVMRHISD